MRTLIGSALLLVATTNVLAMDRIINVSGQYAVCNGCPWSPVGFMFDAGSYTVTPVLANTVPEAQFTAYNFGMGLGWSAAYGVALDRDRIRDFGSAGPHAGAGWPDEATAFAHSAIGNFSIASAQTVYFGVPDSFHGDNFGGVSLKVSTVPLPTTLALLVPAMGLLGHVRQRRARSPALTES